MGWMAPLRHLSAKLLSDLISSEWEPSMGEVTTIGLDLAKHVFQVHGVDSRSLFDAVAVMTGLTPLVSELEARLAADVEFKGVDA